jgi:hypothetical protein
VQRLEDEEQLAIVQILDGSFKITYTTVDQLGGATGGRRCKIVALCPRATKKKLV